MWSFLFGLAFHRAIMGVLVFAATGLVAWLVFKTTDYADYAPSVAVTAVGLAAFIWGGKSDWLQSCLNAIRGVGGVIAVIKVLMHLAIPVGEFPWDIVLVLGLPAFLAHLRLKTLDGSLNFPRRASKPRHIGLVD